MVVVKQGTMPYNRRRSRDSYASICRRMAKARAAKRRKAKYPRKKRKPMKRRKTTKRPTTRYRARTTYVYKKSKSRTPSAMAKHLAAALDKVTGLLADKKE